ncbi:RNA polymerase sigma-70 factor [Streptomyces nanshensis]|uniref:RNA polymerase subunit sigma-24 n=1 Tax=Streptomyces nanshensis TaxID=518642 RepID=A0A1E7L2Y8_9ACTN|nr:RNA polymerase sigma-70 factor [Streptomyces nanshensis]OEV10403.1 RNA polymerase subunit sigma-24 [Streptomyces nanshensis]
MEAEHRDATAVFEEHRTLLLGVAYRMLGRVADAEDVVQDTWLRWASADRDEVRKPAAFLVRVATRLALDRLRSAQSRRETYVGPWLPEPLPTDVHTAPVPDGADRVLLTESVSVAVLVVMESLSPLERAVFVLREAFGFPHEEIAAVLERSPAAVRQLAARARTHVAERTPRYEVDPVQQRELTQRFLDAASRGDIQGLLDMLAPDVRLVGDGGGKAKAPLRTITSADKVGRFVAAIAQQGVADLEFTFTELNGAVGLVGLLGGKPAAVLLLDVAGGRIQSVYLLANPDKVAHLPSR